MGEISELAPIIEGSYIAFSRAFLLNNFHMNDSEKGYDHTKVEADWVNNWESSGIYRWDSAKDRNQTFVIDTPPPTVSGSLHMGHVFSYTQTDAVARYHRMKGENIFYPMGWDDNGLPTERRVQNYFNIRCDPHLPYEPSWKPLKPSSDKEEPKLVSRKNFIEACAILTQEDEKAFENLWRRLGLSIDWSQTYATIDKHCTRVSQRSFLDLVEKKEVYSVDAPMVWDVDFRSAVAQAEIEDREVQGAFHDIVFGVEGGGSLTISTTRPELLAACIAVVAHPEDERYKSLFGKFAVTPLFRARVPILPGAHADPEKGTGILMVCTFGDMLDVEFWRNSGLPMKQIIGLDGRMMNISFGTSPFESQNPSEADKNFAILKGLTAKQAQKKMAELLSSDESGFDGKSRALVGEPKPVKHMVRFYEKGDRPLEILPTRQWFIRILAHKEALVEQGRKVVWHPNHMLSRYENWVNGLNQDWCISRQRFFGVPFPVWYPVKDDGTKDYEKPIYAKVDALPIDPLSDTPPGYKAEQRDKPNGFSGDPDVMDTWATSSLTPQIMSHWSTDQKRHKSLFPMDVRPQAHEIIRTWAFYTIVKAYLHEGEIPWRHATISGWILDPDRKKMSKSKGNVVTPEALLDEHSSDAVRYWALRARLGMDTAFDPMVFKVGRKLTTKLFNASRFTFSHFERLGFKIDSIPIEEITCELDRSLVEKLRHTIKDATSSFDGFDYAAALQHTEEAFWSFCDYYLELVKVRSYHETDTAERRSALATLSWAESTFLRLFAPFLPFVTEELWSRAFNSSSKSVHKAAWPSVTEVKSVNPPTHDGAWDLAVAVMSAVRGAKTEAKRSLKWPVEKLSIKGSDAQIASLRSIFTDLCDASNVEESKVALTGGASEFLVDVVLASE